MFEMGELGLTELTDPARAFLVEHDGAAPGSVVAPTLEGTRPLLVEVQALVAPVAYGTPRRTGVGIDPNRLALLVAVLGRRAGIGLGSHDVYANLAGGLALEEPGLDLPLALALASSLRDRAVRPGTVAIGEVGLLGELRSVTGLERRLREAARLGFARAIVPRPPRGGSAPSVEGLDVIAVGTLRDAIGQALEADVAQPGDARLTPAPLAPRSVTSIEPGVRPPRDPEHPHPRRCPRRDRRAGPGHVARWRVRPGRAVLRVLPRGVGRRLDRRRLRDPAVPHDRPGGVARPQRPGAVHRGVRDRRPRPAHRPADGPAPRDPALEPARAARVVAAAGDVARARARDGRADGGQAPGPGHRRGGARGLPSARAR